mgnify:FL=1
MQKTKTVLIHTSQVIKDIEPFFMSYLKNDLGFYVIFIVSTEEDKNFYKANFKNSFNEIICISREFESLKRHYKEENLVNEALKIEERLDTALWRLFLSERTIGRGFHASGGFRHPKIRLHTNSNHMDILKIAVSQVNFWEDLFKKENIYMSINLPNVGHTISTKKNIHAYRLHEAKFEKRQFWTSNMYIQPDSIKEIYDEIKDKNNKEVDISVPHHGYMTFRMIHIHEFGFLPCLKNSVTNLLRRMYGRFRGYRKGKNIYAFNEFKYFWNRRKDFYNLRKMSSINSKELKVKKYVYFALTTEPEIALHGTATDFFFQLSAINMIARDLPADYILVVKEHFLAMGRRPQDFYKQILELKNVFMADPLDHGLPYIKNAQAVACVTGTSGWEAAAMGIPVISFTKNNCYNFLDHVFYIDNADDTIDALKNICKKTWPNTKSKSNGAAFYASCIKDSFDVLDKDTFVSWKETKRKHEENKIKELSIILHNQLKLKINNIK